MSTLNYPPSLAPYAVPQSTYIATHLSTTPIVALCVNAIIFHPSSDTPRILLLRRAQSDTMPGLWEPPGGGLEPTDASIMHGAAREAFEESGLRVGWVACTAGSPVVGYYESRYRTGAMVGQPMWFGKLDFMCEVDEQQDGEDDTQKDGDLNSPKVCLDPAEHDDYTWASEAEIRAGAMADGRQIPITYKAQEERLLEALRMEREGLIPKRNQEGV